MARVDLAGKLSDARARVEAEAPAEERGLAKFARLTRKDARVRADQDAALAALAKTLMRRRTAKAERITENTLIRVAIDLLLAHANDLRGSTEDELRNSVAPSLRDSATDGLRKSRTAAVRDFRPAVVPTFGASVSRASGTPAAADSRSPAVPLASDPMTQPPFSAGAGVQR